jgi:hypothetical protein
MSVLLRNVFTATFVVSSMEMQRTSVPRADRDTEAPDRKQLGSRVKSARFSAR